MLYDLTNTYVSVGQGMDFFHETWEEALEKAKKEKRLIFIDRQGQL